MPNNVTKILIRRGTNNQRTTVLFNPGEPVYTTDTKRLYVGDGVTLGGTPMGTTNFGVVPALSGSYLGTTLNYMTYNLIALSGMSIGDFIYDLTSTSIYTLTSTSTVPALSDFAHYNAKTNFNPSQFFYDGLNLNIQSNAITPNELNASVVGYGLSGGSGNVLTIAPGTITNNLLSNNTPSNSVKVNPTNTASTPSDLQISTGQFLGRTTAPGSTLRGINFSVTDGIILSANTTSMLLSSRTCLPLAGGVMQGGIDLNSYNITISSIPVFPTDAVNKSYVDNLSVTASLSSLFSYLANNFLHLSGGVLTGPGSLTANGPAVFNDTITASFSPSNSAHLVNKYYVDYFAAGNAANYGNGTGVFGYKLGAPGTLYFKSLSAGANIGIVDNGTGTITLSTNAPFFSPIYTSLTGDGVNYQFYLNGGTSNNPAAYRVDLDGVLQEPNVDYTINTSSLPARISFTNIPYNKAKITAISYVTINALGTQLITTSGSLITQQSPTINTVYNTTTQKLSADIIPGVISTQIRKTTLTGNEDTLIYDNTTGTLNKYALSGITTQITSLSSTYLPKSGGTMTGALTLNADPSTALQAATKQYVDAILNQVIGVNQTWQNVTGSRTVGVTYTNTTGRPIVVNVTNSGGTSNAITLSVDGINIAYHNYNASSGGAGWVSGIVPSGSRYVITTSGSSGASINVWAELR